MTVLKETLDKMSIEDIERDYVSVIRDYLAERKSTDALQKRVEARMKFKEEILEVIDVIRKDVERSVDLNGTVEMNRPCIRTMFPYFMAPRAEGENFVIYNVELRITLPKEDEE